MNRNVETVEISGIRKFFNKVAEVPNALSLTIGEPDFKVPSEIKEAMIDAINRDMTKYTSNMGMDELRDELSRYLATIGINYNSKEICITVGGSEGLYTVFSALLNPNDAVVVPSPGYPAYESIAKILGGRVIACELNNDFTINIEKLSKIITEDKPKLLVLSYPSNPTGAILSKEDKEALYNIAKENDIIIVTDEMYSALSFEDFHSVSQYSDIKDKVILVGGFSKMFSMTGLRIGFVCAVERYMKEIIKVHQYNVSCAPSIAQYGTYVGLKKCMYHVEDIKISLKNRRDYVYERLRSMGIDVIMPKGAFYIFPNIKRFGLDSETFCERLLHEAKVAVVPGRAFGTAGKDHIRISYCYSMEKLKEGMDRIERWISELLI